MITELEPGKARKIQDISQLKFNSTDDLPVLDELIGQDRGLESIIFGLGIKRRGYNIFVSGPSGTGKKTAITQYLHTISREMTVPSDWCYIYNFDDPRKPCTLELTAGKGAELKKNMEWFITQAKESLEKAFSSENYSTLLDKMKIVTQNENIKLISDMKNLANEYGFSLQSSPAGLILTPLLNGQPIDDNAYKELSVENKQEISSRQSQLENNLNSHLLKFAQLEKKQLESINELNNKVASFALDSLIQMLIDLYEDTPLVTKFVNDVKNNILDNNSIIMSDKIESGIINEIWDRYLINLFIDNSSLEGTPVIIEPHPTHKHLFGYLEKEVSMGYLSTDYKLIKPGAIHAANGGFLVLDAEDLFSNHYVWASIKRTLKEGKIKVEDTPEPMEHIATKVLLPEPIPFNGKIIVLGDSLSFYNLSQLDADFKDLFKVKADFDSSIEWNEKAVINYSRFVSSICKNNNLKPMDSSAIAKIIEYSARLADNQEKLSTRFGLITDLIFEVDYYCTLEGDSLCSKKHVQLALEKKIYRSKLYQEKIFEMINRGVLLIDVQGEEVGQINGLAVVGLDNFSFGRPSRVTATVGVGRKGVIDIERESQLGGPLHTKGVHIISGFLNEMYAQNLPLSLTARLVFEQNYSGVDGDSASSTELYSILSALASTPIKQNIAVTGSLNQKGEVQAIGGVNEKIEGFYEVCKLKGLTGDQGVMIPSSNIGNLMLKEEIIDAMNQGIFHIYPVNHVRDGIEILTGIEFGDMQSNGEFEENSVNWLVQKRLKEFAENVRAFYT